MKASIDRIIQRTGQDVVFQDFEGSGVPCVSCKVLILFNTIEDVKLTQLSIRFPYSIC